MGTFKLRNRDADPGLRKAGSSAEKSSTTDRLGASRHALTVGFLADMVFAIGQRILPAFCGARVLFSKRLMFASLLLLNAGCALRVCAEIPAYEGFTYARIAWQVLPFSAILELTAVALFAANLLITFSRPPAHLMSAPAAS